jgi:AhpD family alkylhydroperoxidase
MSRDKIYAEMKEIFGLVPSFMKTIPDSSLELEWGLMKRLEVEEGLIPGKYRELMGVAISAISRCRYCALFHTEMAKLHGATDAEIEEAVHVAKNSAGWSTYVNGMQVDYDVFKSEIKKASEFIRAKEAKKAA